MSMIHRNKKIGGKRRLKLGWSGPRERSEIFDEMGLIVIAARISNSGQGQIVLGKQLKASLESGNFAEQAGTEARIANK